MIMTTITGSDCDDNYDYHNHDHDYDYDDDYDGDYDDDYYDDYDYYHRKTPFPTGQWFWSNF